MAQYIIDNQPAEIGFEIRNDNRSRILQNCKNLLMTRMGEVPYDRYRGFDPALYHLPLPQVRVALLPELDRLFGYEPRARLVSAEASLLENGETLVRVTLEIDE